MSRGPGTRTGFLCFRSYKKPGVSGTWTEKVLDLVRPWECGTLRGIRQGCITVH